MRTVLGITVLVLSASPAVAHDTWILPERTSVNPGQVVTFDLTSGMAFPANEVGVKPERLVRAAVRLGEKIAELTRETGGEKSLQLRATLSEAGIAAVWIESKPRAVERPPAQVKEHLEEIGAWESIGRKWESDGKVKWREAYTKHAKTYVRVGNPEADASWARPVGMELELVPESDPTRLAAGGELTVRLLKNGQPVSDARVGVVAGNAKAGSHSKTDSEGRVRLRLGHGGWWLIRATALEPSTKPDLDWESRFTTLAIFVAAK